MSLHASDPSYFAVQYIVIAFFLLFFFSFTKFPFPFIPSIYIKSIFGACFALEFVTQYGTYIALFGVTLISPDLPGNVDPLTLFSVIRGKKEKKIGMDINYRNSFVCIIHLVYI